MSKPREIFSQIYDQHIEKIYRFIFFKTGSEEIAEDLSSETFLRCWQKFKKDQNKIENPQAFLYQIARNLVTDYYREKGRTQTVSADCVSILDPRPTLEEKNLKNSDLEVIKANLANLKQDYQEVIIWHYIDDLSVAEIAGIVSKSEGAVRVMLHRALKTLKNEIENKSKEV